MEKFVPDMTVAAALDLHPHARWVFAAYHIAGCRGCSSSDTETIEQVAQGYGLPLERFLADLNSLVAPH